MTLPAKITITVVSDGREITVTRVQNVDARGRPTHSVMETLNRAVLDARSWIRRNPTQPRP